MKLCEKILKVMSLDEKDITIEKVPKEIKDTIKRLGLLTKGFKGGELKIEGGGGSIFKTIKVKTGKNKRFLLDDTMLRILLEDKRLATVSVENAEFLFIPN